MLLLSILLLGGCEIDNVMSWITVIKRPVVTTGMDGQMTLPVIMIVMVMIGAAFVCLNHRLM